MSRWFFRTRTLAAYSHTSVFTFPRSASSIPHSHHYPLLFNPFNNPFHPSSIPLQILVDEYKSSQLHHSPVQHDEKIASLAQRYRYSCGSKDAEELHLQLFKNGFVNDLFLCNTLINIYARVGDLGSGRKVFDEMPLRNLVSWSCLISGYTHNRMPNEACELFRKMVSDGFMPNHYAFGSVIRACQGCGECGLKFGMQIHGLMSKTRYANDVTASNVLISMYGNALGMVEYARRAFDSIWPRNLVSLNSMISVYCQRGDAVSAFDIFSTMQKEVMRDGLKPNEYTFGSLISATCSLPNSGLVLLEQLLTRVEKSGFLHDLYVGSALVSGFAKAGSINYAKNIFQKMSYRNVVSLNGLIIGLVRQNRGEEAVELFMEMKDSVELNPNSYMIILTAFPEFYVLENGKRKGSEVHAFLIRSGLLNAQIAIGNGLINMYAKFGAINDACVVFRFMDNKDSVTWNSMISGLDQNKQFLEAVKTFQEMRRTELFPSNFTMISALSSCASLGWISVGEQLHCEGLKLGLDLDVSVSNALLALYGECGYVKECQKAFSLMLDYDQVSWNSLIGALADSEPSMLEAVESFIVMMRAGWHPNRVTFISILAAVSSLSLHELGKQIHALVLKHNVAADTAIENALLACYGKCGDMVNCENIFSRMSDRQDEASWNSMISGYIHNELLPKAMDMVWFVMQKGQRLDGFTFATVLSACATVATLERGMEVHGCSVRACLESDIVVGSALVDMYAKCGRIDYASRFFELMPARNLYSWNSMISGYARHGHGTKSLDLFAQMKLHGPLPDHVTFVGVLSACSHAGLVNEGFSHFDSMSEIYGLTPRMEHFSCMVDLLGRVGELNKMEDFLNKMPVKPNVVIWRTVLGACCKANGQNTALGRRAAKMLLEMEPTNAVNYILLSNMYASGGKWDAVAKTRVAMRKAFAKKEAGCSWVTMKDGVHVFVAGDKSHPEKDLIYEKLKELNAKMRVAGYIPETRFALYDLEGESKEELLSYHSEKIAVAFVLTRPSKMPIRILKNLRVCGDCHSAFKYISQIVERQIVLRDSNRFHHFENGQCSCGDFW
ncbi:hypothetical protein IC582_000577 [Cucumis melo]